MDILDVIRQHFDSIRAGTPLCPPTLIFEEGWLLRWVLSLARKGSLPRTPDGRATWFSEAQLYTAFGAKKGREHAETHTHADGTLGHFVVGHGSKTGLKVEPDATQFVVIEAKLYALLSSNVKNAPFYDQAARTVACMAEILRRANRCPQNFQWLGFYVMAPQSQIDQGLFKADLDKDHIKTTIARRIAQYGNEQAFAELQEWKARWVDPLIEHCDIMCVSWEESIERIRALAPDTATGLQEFYQLCKTFSAPLGPAEPRHLPANKHNDLDPLRPFPPVPAEGPASYQKYLAKAGECNRALQARLLAELRKYCCWDSNSMTVGPPGPKPIRVWNANGRNGECIDICDRRFEGELVKRGCLVTNHRIQVPAAVDQEFITKVVGAMMQVLAETAPS